jgi:hypothetical protein
MSAAEGQSRCRTGVGVYVSTCAAALHFAHYSASHAGEGPEAADCIRSCMKAGVCHGGAQRMDKTALRAALGAWGIPTSGKLELLRQRLAAKIANPNE